MFIPCPIDLIALCKREERARSESNAGVAVKAGGACIRGRFKAMYFCSHCWWSLADDREEFDPG